MKEKREARKSVPPPPRLSARCAVPGTDGGGGAQCEEESEQEGGEAGRTPRWCQRGSPHSPCDALSLCDPLSDVRATARLGSAMLCLLCLRCAMPGPVLAWDL
eukprot:1230449-Rhodomonas_salina.1